MSNTTINYIVLFHETKTKIETSAGYAAVKTVMNLAELNLSVEVLLIDEPNVDFAGEYDPINKEILINITTVYSSGYELDYVVLHEYFHSIQHLAMLDELEGKYLQDNCTMQEEVVYGFFMENSCISLSSYTMAKPCEMGAELFCALFDYYIDIELRPDLEMDNILSYFYAHVIEEVPRYEELYKRLKENYKKWILAC